MPTLARAEAQGAGLLTKLGVSSVAEARKLPADAIFAAGGAQLGGFWPALDGQFSFGALLMSVLGAVLVLVLWAGAAYARSLRAHT